ncbi:hypothetical protein BCR42DRAFT_394096 [Absidia repens]|uniref:Uncharacterized protein n=1 Tax=Absidia repens TaxID=90262 RepID=A0A1X2IDL5_9FUNG|nr:hypothetical protein BCR42DRAFT_394096 [Absidia repens]
MSFARNYVPVGDLLTFYTSLVVMKVLNKIHHYGYVPKITDAMTNVELMDTTSDIPAFTPSLGLRYWMNKMKRTASKAAGQDNNDHDDDNDNPIKHSSPTEVLSSPTTTATKGNMDIQSLGNKSLNDATSTVSISGITGSYFGMSSMNGYDIDSSLRVLHYGASSERSSFLSDDIQSNASIKSKPWISQLISSTHNNNYDGEASTLPITNGAAHHSIRTFSSTEPSPISQHVCYYGKEMDDYSDDCDDDDDYDDGVDGDIFGTSYHASNSFLLVLVVLWDVITHLQLVIIVVAYLKMFLSYSKLPLNYI